jgi:hypothetical protein
MVIVGVSLDESGYFVELVRHDSVFVSFQRDARTYRCLSGSLHEEVFS